MVFSIILERFIEHSPIPVMARSLIERTLNADRINACFDSIDENPQYTRELLFSSVFELMSLVVLRAFPAIHSAYKSRKGDIPVSITAVYDKLSGIDVKVSAELVKSTSVELANTIHNLKGENKPLLPGFRVKMLDGNCLEATEHRLKVLRGIAAGPLPGKSLVIYDPALEMAIDVIPCECGHKQERALLHDVRELVSPDDVMVMDRNFCVQSHLSGIEDKNAFFISRAHKQLVIQSKTPIKQCGSVESGDVFEQEVSVQVEGEKEVRVWRYITIKLKKNTRDGDPEITLITNLPAASVKTKIITELYRKRWSIETMFQELESHLHSEINTLGYPKAALFGFCVALVSYNMMAVIKSAMRSVHSEDKINNNISGYYIAGEIGRTLEGMNVAILPEEWGEISQLNESEFIQLLLFMSGKIQLDKYTKSRRGPKKKLPPRISDKKMPHVSTAKLLAKEKLVKKSP